MKVKAGDDFVRCPYCGSTEFIVEELSAAIEPRELICADCGGATSRRVLVERAEQNAR